jgi:hypothetical protein
VLTAQAIATICNMLAAGSSTAAIAEEIGTTRISLVTRCRQLGIAVPKMPRGPRGKLTGKRKGGFVRMNIHLSTSLRQSLRAAARKHGISLNTEVVRRLQESTAESCNGRATQFAKTLVT